jgi:SAM-dependent methyltransferase
MDAQPKPSEYLPGTYLDEFARQYNIYQERYAEEPRESDKVLINLVSDVVSRHGKPPSELSLLDIGCSTGNFLYHLRGVLPQLALTGGDLAESSIEACMSDPRLDGMQFEVLDIFDLPEQRYDIIVANAVAVRFDHGLYERAIASVAKALNPGGSYLAFEWLHPYEQDLHIVERSRALPQGLNIYFRPFSIVQRILETHGFSSTQFTPFAIPIDLQKGQVCAGNRDGDEELNSYTVKTDSGERMLFRGTLFQPWCHLRSMKTD